MEKVISICLKKMLARRLVSIQVDSVMLLQTLSQLLPPSAVRILPLPFGLEARQEGFVYNILWNPTDRAYNYLSGLDISFDTPFLVSAAHAWATRSCKNPWSSLITPSGYTSSAGRGVNGGRTPITLLVIST